MSITLDYLANQLAVGLRVVGQPTSDDFARKLTTGELHEAYARDAAEHPENSYPKLKITHEPTLH